MSPNNLYFARRMIFSSLILPSIFHITLSYDESFWCGKVQEKVMDVWSGQNISMRFHLEDPILPSQTLVWRKGESIWVKPHDRPLESDGYGDSDVDRYRLTEVSTFDTFDLFIEYTEQNDSGHHVVTIDQGRQPLCLALLLNLTVETPEPICLTKLNNESRKLQMSCEWLQMNEGDRAHFEADNEILYEHQISELNFNGSLNMTHQFSVYVGLDKILDEITVPKKCIVTHRKGKAKEVCDFTVVTPHPIEYTHSKNVNFECCVFKPSKPILLVYDGDGNELSVDSKRKYNASKAGDADCILVFLCGSNEAPSEITILNMKRLDVRRHAKYESLTLSLRVADPKLLHNNSREDEQCEIITMNFQRLDSTLNNQEGISPEIVIDQTCVPTNVHVPSSSPCPPGKQGGIMAEHQSTLISVATIAALVLGCVAGACITKCYSTTYNIPHKDQYPVRMDMGNGPQRGSTVTDDDNGGAVAMTFIAQTPQQTADPGSLRDALNQRSTDEKRPFLIQGAMGPFSGPLGGSLNMPLQGEMVKHDTEGPSDRNAGMASAKTPWPDSTYCSMGDVEGISLSAHSNGSHSINRSRLSSGQEKISRDDLMATNSLMPDLDALYAKPDMSRKTKNLASAESDYDGPRVLLDDYFQSILIPEDSLHPRALSTDQDYHVYDNSLASPTDESTSGGELYMNTL